MTEKTEKTEKSEKRIEDARRFFADELAATAHLEDPALVAAFARVPREAFFDPGPWQIARPFHAAGPYRWTADDDPRHIYHDVVVAIDATRQLNNGQPSALARWIEAAAIQPGESIWHIGCGLGYYTAILAELTGDGGRVLACDVDAALAARAARHLAPWTWVDVEAGDGTAPRGPFDVVLVNAGATRAHAGWLAGLRPGGRMILPLTVHVPDIPGGVGVMLRIDRAQDGWPARFLSQVGIYDCAVARDPADEAELMNLVKARAAKSIRAVSIEPHERAETCLVHLEGFCLQR